MYRSGLKPQNVGADFKLFITNEWVTGLPDKKENRGPVIWWKVSTYNCKAWTGQNTDCLQGDKKIVIGWLFFIVLKCFKMSWTPSPWTKLISLRCTTRLNWLLSLITNSPSLKNPWKANKKIARSKMTLCLSGTVCCKAVKIFCNIDLVMGILESEVFLRFWVPFRILRITKWCVESATLQILWT